MIAFRAHCHYILNTLLDNCAIDAWHTQNKLEQVLKLLLLVGENVLEAEEVDRLVRVLSNINPVLEPSIIAFGAPALEILPVG